MIPHGVCLWSRLFDEGTILALGGALEKALGVADRRPPSTDCMLGSRTACPARKLG